VGQPDEKTIRRACGRAKQVCVYTYGGRGADQWWEKNLVTLERLNNLAVMNLPLDGSCALATLAQPSMQLQCTNEAPRSKLRGITELKHSELPEIFLRLPLPLHIPFDSLPVCPFPYRGHIVPVSPKLPAHSTRFTAGFRRKISRAVMLLNICTIRPGATFGCALQSRWM